MTRSCDAPSQKVCATPPSRENRTQPFSLPTGSGDGASPGTLCNEGVAATPATDSLFNCMESV
jgi:hypothetical protein